MTSVQEIQTVFANAKISSSSGPELNWHQIQPHDNIAISYDTEEADFLIAIGGSRHDHSEWISITTLFQKKIALIPNLPEVFSHSICLKVKEETTELRFFCEFLNDLITDSHDQDLDQHFTNIFAIWKDRFTIYSSVPDSRELRGLFGELAVLTELVRFAGNECAGAWVGPLGELHDFQHDSWHIEVKESMKPDPVVDIHPVQQLEPIHIPFNLAVVSLSRDDQGITIRSLVDDMTSTLSPTPGMQQYFDDVLQASVFPRLTAEQKNESYRINSIMRLGINETTNVLMPSKIYSDVQYDDIRWKLRMSNHRFVEASPDFWSDPSK